ncbi:bifunctional alpha/beta hydrolase/OsmC family protein [Novosphingobium sp. BL-8A]|uniref:bifunctional alpha/beta hydrolase/OsmC family protein n=1 Tax=Novosphingobium sp. BL-8A TaxID=3127639 RepID=UPI003756ECE4
MPMSTRTFEFTSRSGLRLAGRLEVPSVAVRGWAIFAHCFACGKDSHAAVRIARRLADAGIGVLRFDFTGLGGSAGDFEGDFEPADQGRDVQDLLDAAAAMAVQNMTPSLLVGHSLGGSAVLAAAASLPMVEAVATIAAPFDISRISVDGGTVSIEDKAFYVGRHLAEELRRQEGGKGIAQLGRPLLLLHSPTDGVVPVASATRIYLSAQHPKSFVALDGADHLLTQEKDAEFAADMIATWAGRYLKTVPADIAPHFDAEASETGLGQFQLAMRAGQAQFLADEPVDVGGMGSGATPYNLLSAALAACTTMTLRLYAARKNWPVRHIHTLVKHHKSGQGDRPDTFSRRIDVTGDVTAAQLEELQQVAERCPVHRTLEAGSRFDVPEVELLAGQN